MLRAPGLPEEILSKKSLPGFQVLQEGMYDGIARNSGESPESGFSLPQSPRPLLRDR